MKIKDNMIYDYVFHHGSNSISKLNAANDSFVLLILETHFFIAFALH